MAKQVIVPGHTLPYEGRVYRNGYYLGNGPGKGACSCGEQTEEELPTTAARQRWHREHKVAILAAREAKGAGDDQSPAYGVISGALRSTIQAHGPLTLELVPSATKRIAGNFANVGMSNLYDAAKGAAARYDVSDKVAIVITNAVMSALVATCGPGVSEDEAAEVAVR